ncbi:hypothetical protein HKD37_07G017807 [Glycine soja]
MKKKRFRKAIQQRRSSTPQRRHSSSFVFDSLQAPTSTWIGVLPLFKFGFLFPDPEGFLLLFHRQYQQLRHHV